MDNFDWTNLKHFPWKEATDFIGGLFGRMKQKRIENVELQKDLRKLALEFYENAELAMEYSRTGVAPNWYNDDHRLSYCDTVWRDVSHNYSEELKLPIKLEHLINQTYDKFQRGDNTKEDYEALAQFFRQYAEQYEEIAEWK